MDGRERLRAYLEQRRELGESEFVLDGMSVADALRAIDKLRPAGTVQPPRPPRARPLQPSTMVAETRSFRTPDAAPQASVPPKEAAPLSNPGSSPRAASFAKPAAAPSGTDAAATPASPASDDLAARYARGIVIGTAGGGLFEQNPYRDVTSLAELAKLIEACTLCKLCETARCAVPGDGNTEGEFMCVGEAPGANEDETGHPFVGQAGALLTRILAAINLGRDQVFITNVLKHRPPGNRNPLPDEVKACTPYLVRQIQLVQPKVILALGTFAAQTLLETKTPISKLRGAIHKYHGIPLIVTYHPAALLRNAAWKRPTWEDVKLARLVLDTSK